MGFVSSPSSLQSESEFQTVRSQFVYTYLNPVLRVDFGTYLPVPRNSGSTTTLAFYILPFIIAFTVLLFSVDIFAGAKFGNYVITFYKINLVTIVHVTS